MKKSEEDIDETILDDDESQWEFLAPINDEDLIYV